MCSGNSCVEGVSIRRKPEDQGKDFEGFEVMRTAVIFCRNVRRLSSVVPQGCNDLVASSRVNKTFSTVGRKDGAPSLVGSRGAGGSLAQLSDGLFVGSARFMGYSSFGEKFAEKIPEDTEKHPEEAIERASQELFEQSNVTAYHEESPTEETEGYVVKDHIAEKPGAEVANEVWGAKEQDGTSVFTDHSDKVSTEA